MKLAWDTVDLAIQALERSVTYEKHVIRMDLNISAPMGHRGTCLEAEQTRSSTTGKLTVCDEEHTVRSEMIELIKEQTFGKFSYIVIFIAE